MKRKLQNLQTIEFKKKIKKILDSGQQPENINIPWNVFKYVSEGRYGQTEKVFDTSFDKDSPPAGIYVADSLNTIQWQLPITQADYPTQPNIQSLNLVGQGTAMSQTIGNKISMRKLKIDLYLTLINLTFPSNTPTPTPYPARVIIFYDRQPTQAYPDVLDVINTIGTSGAPYEITSATEININNNSRFVFLYDVTKMIPGLANDSLTPTGITNDEAYKLQAEIDLKDLETVFNSAAPGVITSINTGCLNILSWSQNMPINNAAWGWTGNCRLYFHDN